MNPVEYEIQVLATEAFIAQDPQLLDVWRQDESVSDGAGGRVKTEPFRVASGTFRLIPQQDKVPTVQTFNGTNADPKLVIMGLPGIDFQRGDYFTWRGYRWEIVAGHDLPNYESKADVIRKGAAA
jgi:hypothetical protein